MGRSAARDAGLRTPNQLHPVGPGERRGPQRHFCVDHLVFGNYVVPETAPPAGYAIDDGTGHTVIVNANSTFGDGNETAFSATDTPLTDLLVRATSQVRGATQSQITCVDASNADIGN